jgi:hypothetical protein
VPIGGSPDGSAEWMPAALGEWLAPNAWSDIE